MGQLGGATYTLFAVLIIVPLVGGGVAGSEQAASPEWSDELFSDIERMAAEYNAQTDDDVGFLERWLLGDERINLHVRDADGTRAVYALRLDEQRQVTEVRQGRFETPTVRIRTKKRVIEEISADDNTETAVKQAIRSDRIRLERVFYLLPGMVIFIGARDVIFGGGVAVAYFAVTKFFGIKPVFSVLATIKEKLLVLLRYLWEGLSGIATVLSILDYLDKLDRVKQRISQQWAKARKRMKDILDRILPQDETDKKQTE